MNKPNYFRTALLLPAFCFLIACSKNGESPKPKDEVSISNFAIDVTNTSLFAEGFVGHMAAYSNVVLIKNVNDPATVSFTITTNPVNYSNNISYSVKNDDGSETPTSNYLVSGNQIKFKVPGGYRIRAAVIAGAGNHASAPSSELAVQIASNIPDDNFRAQLKKIASLQFSGEILNLTTLSSPRTVDISNQSIENLEGISNLKGIDTIYCNNNKLTNLDVSSVSNLKALFCANNQLTSLHIKGLSNLVFVHCSNNQLTTIDLQELTNLAALFCNANKLTSLNLQGLSNLTSLEVDNNQLSAIDLTGLNKLGNFNCSNNQISSLDVNGIVSLKSLACINNKISSLDVSNLKNLINFSCFSGTLTNLNLSTTTGSYLSLIDFRLPTSLQCVPGIKQIKIDRGSLLKIRTFNANGILANDDFDAVANCP